VVAHHSQREPNAQPKPHAFAAFSIYTIRRRDAAKRTRGGRAGLAEPPAGHAAGEKRRVSAVVVRKKKKAS